MVSYWDRLEAAIIDGLKHVKFDAGEVTIGNIKIIDGQDSENKVDVEQLTGPLGAGTLNALMGKVKSFISKADGTVIDPAQDATLVAIKDTDGIKKIIDDVSARMKDSAGNGITSTDETGGVRSLDVSVKSGDIEIEVVGLKDTGDVRINPAKEDGNLADVKTNTANTGTPLQNTKIPNIIPQEAVTFEPQISINKDNVGLAKELGGNLAGVKSNTDNVGTPLQNTKIPNIIPQEAVTFEPQISINKDNVGLAKEAGGNLESLAGRDFATQATMASILAQLDVALSTRATEATIASILAELDVALSTRASETTLASIKDTDGIKKITDPLPAGTNNIGKVTVDDKTLLAPTILHNNVLIQDVAEHPSSGQNIGKYQEKTVYIELIKTLAPGDIDVWVEISYDNVTYFLLGEKAVYSASNDDTMSFTTHALYMRMNCQASSGDVTNYWTIKTTIEAKT